MRIRYGRTLVVLTVLAALLAACGTPAAETDPADTDSAASETESQADAAEEAEPEGDVEQETEPEADAETATESDPESEPVLGVGATELGDVLVDGDGMTLYLFTRDPEGESVCTEDCLAAWPPLLVEDEPTVGDGVDESLVSTITRDDGTTQVTYGGAPLYTWASDQEPGDVTGQGVQDVWFVVAPDGSAISNGEDAAQGEPDPGGTAPSY